MGNPPVSLDTFRMLQRVSFVAYVDCNSGDLIPSIANVTLPKHRDPFTAGLQGNKATDRWGRFQQPSAALGAVSTGWESKLVNAFGAN